MVSMKEGDSSSIISAAQRHLRQYEHAFEHGDGGMKQTTVSTAAAGTWVPPMHPIRNIGTEMSSTDGRLKSRPQLQASSFKLQALLAKTLGLFGLSADPAQTSSNMPRNSALFATMSIITASILSIHSYRGSLSFTGMSFAWMFQAHLDDSVCVIRKSTCRTMRAHL